MTRQPDQPELEIDRHAEHAPRRLLLTNDDGLDSPGLRELARTLAADHDVIVAAPAEDVSGAGTSIGALEAADPVGLRRADFDGIEAYALEGPPGLAVMAAALGAFGDRPDLVVSGPNAGLNTGTSIIHSGTVGAALTARGFGISGVAFSLARGERWCWETAAAVAPEVVDWVLRQRGLVALNVNVPALPAARLRGARWANIDEFGHFNVASHGRGGTVLDLGVSDRSTGRDPDCDTALCLDGYVTLTLLSPVQAAPAPDDDPAVVVGLTGG